MAGLYAVNMSTAVLSVRLPEELKRRLDDLGNRTGRPATFYVRQAVESYIDDLEYAYALKAEAEAVRRGEIKTRRLDEIEVELRILCHHDRMRRMRVEILDRLLDHVSTCDDVGRQEQQKLPWERQIKGVLDKVCREQQHG